uniref:Orf122b n=1 Tax=Batis maritima TaxID=4436 RepID=A0A068BBX6_BATMA|nr:orf122b [Batis maritima]AIC83415.1 orf122b [Batis maritima]
MKSKSRSSSVISKKCPGRTTKDGLHILAFGACLLQAHQHVGPQPGGNPPFRPKLVLKMDLIALNAPPSLRLLVCHQNLAEPSRYMAAVFIDASSDYVRQAAPYPKSLRSLASRVPTNAFGFA